MKNLTEQENTFLKTLLGLNTILISTLQEDKDNNTEKIGAILDRIRALTKNGVGGVCHVFNKVYPNFVEVLKELTAFELKNQRSNN